MLTAQQHGKYREDFLHIRDGGDVSEPDTGEYRKTEVECGDVPRQGVRSAVGNVQIERPVALLGESV